MAVNLWSLEGRLDIQLEVSVCYSEPLRGSDPNANILMVMSSLAFLI